MTAQDAGIPVDEVTRPWWDATRERQLVIQRCCDCRGWQHYPRALCICCGGTSLCFEQASGHGVVDTWTEVRRTIHPDLPAPYLVARVRLAEGPVLLTRLVEIPVPGEARQAEDQASLIGQAVTVAWLPLPDGRHLPVFRPSERSS